MRMSLVSWRTTLITIVRRTMMKIHCRTDFTRFRWKIIHSSALESANNLFNNPMRCSNRGSVTSLSIQLKNFQVEHHSNQTEGRLRSLTIHHLCTRDPLWGLNSRTQAIQIKKITICRRAVNGRFIKRYKNWLIGSKDNMKPRKMVMDFRSDMRFVWRFKAKEWWTF